MARSQAVKKALRIEWRNAFLSGEDSISAINPETAI
jgi:hypothetical protein